MTTKTSFQIIKIFLDYLAELGGAWRSLAELGGAWRSLAELGGAWRSLAELGGATNYCNSNFSYYIFVEVLINKFINCCYNKHMKKTGVQYD